MLKQAPKQEQQKENQQPPLKLESEHKVVECSILTDKAIVQSATKETQIVH